MSPTTADVPTPSVSTDPDAPASDRGRHVSPTTADVPTRSLSTRPDRPQRAQDRVR